MKLHEINNAIAELERLMDDLENGETTLEEQVEQIKRKLDTLEGAREEKLLNIARWRKQLQTEVKEVIGGEIKRLQDRKRSYDNRIKSLGEYLHWGLGQTEDKRIKSPVGTLWLQRNPKPSVEITDITWLDLEFWTDYVEIPVNGRVELPAGDYRFCVTEDGKINVKRLDIDAIAEHFATTGEIPIGTKIEWGSHVRFR